MKQKNEIYNKRLNTAHSSSFFRIEKLTYYCIVFLKIIFLAKRIRIADTHILDTFKKVINK